MKRKKKIISWVLTFLMLISLLAGCTKESPTTKENDPSDIDEELSLLEYTVELDLSAPATTLDNPNDVVTPYIEKKFMIKVKEVMQGATQQIPFKDRLGAMAAAGNLPDVIIAGKENVDYAVSTGKYGDIEASIEKMENLNKYIDSKFWPRFMNNGKKTQIPLVGPNTTTEQFTNDPYNIPFNIWSLWTREDVLEKAGYSFKPLAEIQAEYADKGIVPPESEFAITPAIDTPEKFMEYLKKVADLNLMVNDKPLIPFSGVGWNQFHLGSMFDFGHWRIDSSDTVDGFLGSPGAKDYYNWLRIAYQEELIDADFISQKDDQLQQKVATGRVAAGMYVPDMKGASNALLQMDKKAAVRYIPWPKIETGGGAFDIFENGFWRVTVRNDFKDKERLIEYFDWFFSDEGLDIITWGPEEAGLWKMDGDKKVFVDPDVEQACLNGELGMKGADYYGLYDWRGTYFPYLSKAAICAPTLQGFNPKSYVRSYPPKIELDIINKGYFGIAGDDFSGRYSYGDGSLDVSNVNSWYWSKWTDEKCATVLMAKTEEEFNRVWDNAYTQFAKDTEYDKAKSLMEIWFAENYDK